MDKILLRYSSTLLIVVVMVAGLFLLLDFATPLATVSVRAISVFAAVATGLYVDKRRHEGKDKSESLKYALLCGAGAVVGILLVNWFM